MYVSRAIRVSNPSNWHAKIEISRDFHPFRVFKSTSHTSDDQENMPNCYRHPLYVTQTIKSIFYRSVYGAEIGHVPNTPAKRWLLQTYKNLFIRKTS